MFVFECFVGAFVCVSLCGCGCGYMCMCMCECWCVCVCLHTHLPLSCVACSHISYSPVLLQASFEPLGFTVAVAKDRAIESLMQVGAGVGAGVGVGASWSVSHSHMKLINECLPYGW